MINITNTVDAVGDETLTDSMICKSITEFQDDHILAVGMSAFRECLALKNVVLPEVKELSGYAFSGCKALISVYMPKLQTLNGYNFQGCTSLTYLDFPVLSSVGYNDLANCTALETLILRSTAGVCEHNSGALFGSKIAKGEGYIYVPAALLGDYKIAKNWSPYAAQFRAIEEYPEICDRYTWEQVFASIEDGTYTQKYSIGDAIPMDLGDEGIVDMQIAAFDADPLADGSGTAAITWVSNQILKTPKSYGSHEYTDEFAKCGWSSSDLRTYLQNVIKPLIPEAVRKQIVPVTKTSIGQNCSVGNSYFTEMTTEELWLPSVREVCLYDNYESTGPQYSDLFSSNASRMKKKLGSMDPSSWWLRSYHINPYQYTMFITNEGKGSYHLDGDRGIVPCFCTGKTIKQT